MFLRLSISITDRCAVTIEAQYLKPFRYFTTPTHEFFVQNCISFPRLHYKGTHTDFRNHIYLKEWYILAYVINNAILRTCSMYWRGCGWHIHCRLIWSGSNALFSLPLTIVSLYCWALQICLPLIGVSLSWNHSYTDGTHTDFQNHVYLKYCDILAHVINTAILHTCSIYWLAF